MTECYFATKFKVGDIVIGNESSSYVVTRCGWVGVVQYVWFDVCSRKEYITVHGQNKSGEYCLYDVSAECFDLYCENNEFAAQIDAMLCEYS